MAAERQESLSLRHNDNILSFLLKRRSTKKPIFRVFSLKKLPLNNQTGENTALLSVDSKGDSACFLAEAFKMLLLK